jgi:hypothetical protein
MHIELLRSTFDDDCTLGTLSLDGKFECFTLEDVDRHLEDPKKGVKVYGNTAIPRGVYKVIINKSTRFKRDMPLLLQVPYFEGIRIHSGNTSADTDGCILLGDTRANDRIGESRIAFDRFFAKLRAAIDGNEEVIIEVR